MKIECPNPSCKELQSGPKSRIGQWVSCNTCGHRFIWTDCFHSGQSFVIYDLETTGLSPDNDEVIQIAAVRLQAGCLFPDEQFFSYAKPRRRISSFIQRYTGISNHDVEYAPRPAEAICKFASWIGDATLIAHNAKRFDSKFLAASCRRYSLKSREIDCIDSISLSKMLFGRTRGTGHSLDHIKARLNLAESKLRRHDARGDVDILGRAILEMYRRLDLDCALNGVPRHLTRIPAIK